MKQTSFFKTDQEHGGALNLGKAKMPRPISTKKSMHVVLKSHADILYKNKQKLIQIIHRQKCKSNVQLYSCSIQRNHIHLLIRVKRREDYKSFIRAVAGLMAKFLGKGLWKLSPYTKIISWGREFKNVESYIYQNAMEAAQMWPYITRCKRGSSTNSS